jgi:hypothetical protein
VKNGSAKLKKRENNCNFNVLLFNNNKNKAEVKYMEDFFVFLIKLLSYPPYEGIKL